MKVTIPYRCEDCQITFHVHCGVPDDIPNTHMCDGVSKFSGTSGRIISYMCGKCGHMTTIDIVDMIPAMAAIRHGCGRECT